MRLDDDKDADQTMTTVFLSGSRKINRLNNVVRARLQTIVDRGLRVLVGDAYGADTALQSYLNEKGYRNVTIYCSGPTCRNNVGSWITQNIDVDPKLRGRAFYTEKDRGMAAQAQYGLVVWDGRSPGSLNNVFEMLRHGKMVAVYVAPRRGFLDVKELADTDVLLQAYAQYPAQDPSSLPLFAKVARDSSTSNKPAGTKSGIDEDDTQTIQNSR